MNARPNHGLRDRLAFTVGDRCLDLQPFVRVVEVGDLPRDAEAITDEGRRLELDVDLV